MRIIPAIDILGGKCVRLAKGDYSSQKIYGDDPLEVAKSFEAAGIQYLHLVDLDGARSQHIVNYKILSAIATHTGLIIDFGGGVKSTADLAIAFENGARQITAGSIAVKDPQLVLDWVKEFGSDRILLGADCLERKIAVHGWQQTSDTGVIEFIQSFAQKGITSAVCTDISKDGMLAGPAVDLYSEILDKITINLVASGGISSVEDLVRLANIGCEAAIIGKAIYERRITLDELSKLC
jgi:phosphoribosylformimino-5-aminoimidazole carboxamide ribotide isomerase